MIRFLSLFPDFFVYSIHSLFLFLSLSLARSPFSHTLWIHRVLQVFFVADSPSGCTHPRIHIAHTDAHACVRLHINKLTIPQVIFLFLSFIFLSSRPVLSWTGVLLALFLSSSRRTHVLFAGSFSPHTLSILSLFLSNPRLLILSRHRFVLRAPVYLPCTCERNQELWAVPVGIKESKERHRASVISGKGTMLEWYIGITTTLLVLIYFAYFFKFNWIKVSSDLFKQLRA